VLTNKTKIFEKKLFILLLALVLSGCSEKFQKTVICDISSANNYNYAVANLLPDYKILNDSKKDISSLKGGAVVESYDILAEPSLEQSVAAFWYPQYITTSVIAVDRSVSDANISGWEDLLNISETVGIPEDSTELRLLMASIAYSLEGEEFSFGRSSALLSALHEKGRLTSANNNPPVLICFDTQAALRKMNGDNIDIIIPKEGTLSFRKGLLSNHELRFDEDIHGLMDTFGLRSLNGEGKYYPDLASYASSSFVENYNYFNNMCENATYVFKRDVQKINNYLYSSADGRAHMIYALVFIIIVIIWIGNVIKRTIQKGIRQAVLITASLVIGWVFLRMFKYQIPTGTLSQYCWYGYYFFQLGLSISVLWMSWVIDRPNEINNIPLWLYICAAINLTLFIFVFTNNSHHLAFAFNPEDPYYNINYQYGPAYYLAIATIFVQALFAQFFFIQKSWKSPRKASFMFPAIFYLLLCSYCVGYILRIPFAWESDLTIVTGVFVIVFIEACIKAGLIPVNTKYKKLFENSPFKMQILNSQGEVMLSSALKSDNTPLPLIGKPMPEDFIIHTNSITGGSISWQEDISSINRLNKETAASVANLKTANSILIEEERIKRNLESAEAKTSIIKELETEIKSKTKNLSVLVAKLPQHKPCQYGVVKVAALLCYIKRRCNFFFRLRETDMLSPNELMIYFNELREFAAFSDIDIHISYGKSSHIPTKQAVLFYDFLYEFIDHALNLQISPLLIQITEEENCNCLKILYPSYDNLPITENILQTNINISGGYFNAKLLDDMFSIALSFPRGGIIND